MMNQLANFNDVINSFVWGNGLWLLLFTGLLTTLLTGVFQVRKIGHWMRETLGSLFNKDVSGHVKGKSISQFQALCTALAATIGVGNIAGVATAITIGGPGAVFWMWISALLGMCTKFAEVTIAINYRERNKDGDWVGGPMYYITKGLGKNFNWLASLFAVLERWQPSVSVI